MGRWVKSHLAPYLPGKLGAESAVGMVSAAVRQREHPADSVDVHHDDGSRRLKRATQVALLNANYIAKKLEPHFPTLYAGRNGFVAHECILDLRPIKDASGISAEDVAKRLMDYGFHAPTLSFPVAGADGRADRVRTEVELDRFIEAMIAIREDIRAVEKGDIDRDDNPLKNAPHTAAMVMAENWEHDYTRERAAFPVAF